MPPIVTEPVPVRVTLPLIFNTVGLLLEFSCSDPVLVIVPCRMVVLLSFPLYVPELVNPFNVALFPPGVSMTPPELAPASFSVHLLGPFAVHVNGRMRWNLLADTAGQLCQHGFGGLGQHGLDGGSEGERHRRAI